MISHTQEKRLEELIEKYEASFVNSTTAPMATNELMELRWLAIKAYKEQKKQLGMMRG